MKKYGIINVQLAGYIAGLGHKDLFMVGDAGMPVPKDVPIVDLALCGGVPTFVQVMDAICDEVEIEGYTIAGEIAVSNEPLLNYIREKLKAAKEEMIGHDELKKRSHRVKFAVRTGEFTPYPNIIIKAGVAFKPLIPAV